VWPFPASTNRGPALSNERKFVASSIQAGAAQMLLDHELLPDGEFPANTLNSIYFETRSFRAYAEKVDGDNLKQKVRLRWYQQGTGPRTDQAFLEVKSRVGSARHKTRKVLTVHLAALEARPLADLRLGEVLPPEAMLDLPGSPEQWLPAVCITYDRRRYRCPVTHGRVALDQNIRVMRFNPDLFPAGVPLRFDQIVCEFKDAAQVEIPWAGRLERLGFRMRSFSKFGEAIRLLQLGGAPA
jgi:hypothetical protein